MRRLNRIGPVLCTLLLLVLGANMPRLVSAALDHSLGQRMIQRDIGSASLALVQNADFFQTLQIFRNGYSQVELPEGYYMTAEEAEAAAAQALLEVGMPEMVHVGPEVTPVLLTGNADGLSGVFWRCVWSGGEGAPEILWLDDQSGTIVSFQVRTGASTAYISTISTDIFPDEVMRAGEYCRLNYPVDSAALEVEKAGKTDSYYKLTLVQREEEQAQSCTLFLRWSPGWLYFNI